MIYKFVFDCLYLINQIYLICSLICLNFSIANVHGNVADRKRLNIADKGTQSVSLNAASNLSLNSTGNQQLKLRPSCRAKSQSSRLNIRKFESIQLINNADRLLYLLLYWLHYDSSQSNKKKERHKRFQRYKVWLTIRSRKRRNDLKKKNSK